MKRLNVKLILMMVAVLISTLAVPQTGALASPVEVSTGSEMIHILFAKDATSAVVSGNLAANARVQYILRAFYGQLMDVTLSAPEGTTLKVTSLAGTALTPVTGTSGTTGFRGYLPRSGNYVLTVTAGSKAAAYTLNVFIPQRISFKWGTTSAVMTGSLKAQEKHDYILKAAKGQLMEISITPDVAANSPQIIIYGVDGTVLQSGMGEATSFRGLLPLTEDYIVTVRAGAKDVSFSMNVIIPVRVTLAATTSSANFSGWLPAQQSQYYVLNGLKDQTLKVDAGPAAKVQLIIYGADGTVLKSGMGEGATFSGKLTTSQDYIIVVRTGALSASYTLAVSAK